MSEIIGLKKYVPSEGLVNRNSLIGPRVMLRLYASLAWNLEKLSPVGFLTPKLGLLKVEALFHFVLFNLYMICNCGPTLLAGLKVVQYLCTIRKISD